MLVIMVHPIGSNIPQSKRPTIVDALCLHQSRNRINGIKSNTALTCEGSYFYVKPSTPVLKPLNTRMRVEKGSDFPQKMLKSS